MISFLCNNNENLQATSTRNIKKDTRGKINALLFIVCVCLSVGACIYALRVQKKVVL